MYSQTAKKISYSVARYQSVNHYTVGIPESPLRVYASSKEYRETFEGSGGTLK